MFQKKSEQPEPHKKSQEIQIKNEEHEINCLIEKMPCFPGGMTAIQKFMKENLKYPSQGCVNGRVFVGFTISETGKLSDINVLRGLSQNCNEEAIRIIKLMPNWIPGEQAGKPIPVRYALPINFILAE